MVTLPNKTLRPTHRIFAVTKADGSEARWDELGAAWPSKSGKALNLKFSKVPPTEQYLVMCEVTANKANIRPAD